ncbi:MAG TPA: hypothetical protein PLG17_01175 [Thermodesulfobacteriota bacterium]|nr:hypothetical protein [Deltaproteobacteria bacterium]HNR12113.1 hypothetical protein [Thermodesulfobacteriota bacterium]HNU71255.1 hypothetical protein [Thermodesulfobacteriota bacterium]HQO77102.1 hypothetical protein [Thermodesulfobacteriota bacterium]
MLPETTNRVSKHTAEHLNQQIRQRTRANIQCFAAGGPEAIDRRLAELDAEWDIERTLEANASTLMLIGISLGALVNKKWLFLPAVVASFLFQHALQGWCPPVPVFRRMGIRTAYEIEQERYALKAIRGDFQETVGARDRAMAVVNL